MCISMGQERGLCMNMRTHLYELQKVKKFSVLVRSLICVPNQSRCLNLAGKPYQIT